MNTKTLSLDDIEHLIEQKLLEFFGDPDFGLELKENFEKKLKKRLKKYSRRISHKKIIQKYGSD